MAVALAAATWTEAADAAAGDRHVIKTSTHPERGAGWWEATAQLYNHENWQAYEWHETNVDPGDYARWEYTDGGGTGISTYKSGLPQK